MFRDRAQFFFHVKALALLKEKTDCFIQLFKLRGPYIDPSEEKIVTNQKQGSRNRSVKVGNEIRHICVFFFPVVTGIRFHLRVSASWFFTS